MLLILAFLCLAGSFVLLGKLVTQPQRDRQASLRRAKAYSDTGDTGDRETFVERFGARYGDGLARLARRLDPRATEERAAVKLVSSGLAHRFSPTGFLALKVVLAAAGAVLGSLLGLLLGGAGWAIIAGVGAGALGFFVPDLVARSRTSRRRDEIQRSLPDALDILAVSVEAGLGFDAGLAKLGEHMDGPLVEEFNLVLSELRIGEARSTALRKMADRVDVPEVTLVVNALLQADQMGSPLGNMLRIQAQESRHRRQVAAEETAMKAPVKMLFPTVLFIFPAMFVVILGPAVIQIMDEL
jgi:tight adherence protein C